MVIEAYMHRNAAHSEEDLLVAPYCKNSKSAVAPLQGFRFMKGMRDGKGPITSSALNKYGFWLWS